ncbi:MAG TPA: cohesin domain-containing protein, partial [Bryobacteraceae bacterium]
MRLATALLFVCLFSSLCSMAFAQNASLSLAAGSGAPGSTVTLPLSLSAEGTRISGVQWTIAYSTADFSSASVSLGSAADSAGKTVACNTSTPGQYRCLISGLNPNLIADGVVATTTLTVAANTTNTSSAISVTGSLGSTPQGSELAVSAGGSSVTIPQGPRLASFACSPATVVAPGSSACTVTLDRA